MASASARRSARTRPPRPAGHSAHRAGRPALDLRKRLGLPAKPLDAADHFVLAHAGARDVVLRVDRVLDVLDVPPGDIEQVCRIASTEAFLDGIAKLPDGLVLIHDLGRFLSAADALALDSAMAPPSGEPDAP